ncbi:hypothetical protein M8C21_000748 [Ambrosia artemisiifolia]|uniref:Extradiol ring-cleavage dioxygenase class III enzyme subunit B domain-containing protein n=1 Tax=Ambrosia artemisiifolia TaxID=4212 RepID=A0AAD5CL58_AMBAR|nr:hypothetical protein M8C21_000748 [Ambrosia artemisiifolia]
MMMMAMNGMKIPDTYYISHGSPTLSIDETMPARHFLQSFQQKVYPRDAPRPSSILVISGHWETDYPTVNVVDGRCETIYDFYNFPKSMYQLKYPVPGAPKLAKRVKELLMSSKFKKVNEERDEGSIMARGSH